MTHDNHAAEAPRDATYRLPSDCEPVEESMFTTAMGQTERAFTGGGGDLDKAVDHLLRYYAPDSTSAGATFPAVPATDDNAITGSDLWAVSALAMKVAPNAGRALMDGGL